MQFVSVVSGEGIQVTVPVESAGLRARSLKRLQHSAGGIHPVPQELADNSIARVEVVADSACRTPAGADGLGGRTDWHVDHHGKVTVDFGFATLIVLRLERLQGRQCESQNEDVNDLQSTNLHCLPRSESFSEKAISSLFPCFKTRPSRCGRLTRRTAAYFLDVYVIAQMFPVPGKTLQSNIRRVLSVLQAFSAELGGTTIVASWKPRNVRVTGVFARPWTVLQPFLDGDATFLPF